MQHLYSTDINVDNNKIISTQISFKNTINTYNIPSDIIYKDGNSNEIINSYETSIISNNIIENLTEIVLDKKKEFFKNYKSIINNNDLKSNFGEQNNLLLGLQLHIIKN